MDETLVDLFGQWLKAFAVAQGAMSEDFAHEAVAELEMRIAATPAEGLRGLAVKLGLQRFLNEHADASSELAASAYTDLIRLTGNDPASAWQERCPVYLALTKALPVATLLDVKRP